MSNVKMGRVRYGVVVKVMVVVPFARSGKDVVGSRRAKKRVAGSGASNNREKSLEASLSPTDPELSIDEFLTAICGPFYSGELEICQDDRNEIRFQYVDTQEIIRVAKESEHETLVIMPSESGYLRYRVTAVSPRSFMTYVRSQVGLNSHC